MHGSGQHTDRVGDSAPVQDNQGGTSVTMPRTATNLRPALRTLPDSAADASGELQDSNHLAEP